MYKRQGQNVPFRIDAVDDFSNVKLFTIPTVAIKIIKGVEMVYPMNAYKVLSLIHIWDSYISSYRIPLL